MRTARQFQLHILHRILITNRPTDCASVLVTPSSLLYRCRGTLATTTESSSMPHHPAATMDDAVTPTNDTFASGALAAQKPLPSTFSDFPEPPQSADSPNDKPLHSHSHRESSQGARKARDPSDMNVDDSDGDVGHGDDAAGLSDTESIAADGKANKKKKSLRFYCTDYPPCNLSFTRSEHLARHIRKHTGERPFQCHCSRRFSRLDNLRQHAQTVHVNEDIPMDSLAATGTRFQRQIRTERVRTTAGRARTSTTGSMGTPARGHSKSLSTSSITSVSSAASSVFSPRDDVRRRPPPLVMADPRATSSYRSGLDNQYRPLTPTDYASPPSATFSNGPGSPHWGHAVVSPSPSHSRAQSMYTTGVRTPGRRLSVPSSTTNPFQSLQSLQSLQSPQGAAFGRALFSPGSMNASSSGLFSPPNASNVLASPTTSTTSTSTWSRRDSTSTVADEAWRRRTWHPDTRGEYNAANNGPATTAGSHLSHVISSSQYQTPPTASVPLANPAAQQTNLRLPGIESFDPIPRHRQSSPPRRAPSPMAIDSDNAPTAGPPASILRSHYEPGADDRGGQLNGQWEMPLRRNMARMENTPGTSPRDGASAWASDTSRAVMAQSELSAGNAHQRQLQPSVRFEDDVRAAPSHYGGREPAATGYTRGHYHTVSAPSFNVSTPRHQKRQGWYQGPPPSTSAIDQRVPDQRVDRMVHPNLASGFQGFPTRVPQTVHEHRQQQQTTPQPSEPQRYSHPQQEHDSPESLRRLEALVAVATSEVSTAAAY